MTCLFIQFIQLSVCLLARLTRASGENRTDAKTIVADHGAESKLSALSGASWHFVALLPPVCPWLSLLLHQEFIWCTVESSSYINY